MWRSLTAATVAMAVGSRMLLTAVAVAPAESGVAGPGPEEHIAGLGLFAGQAGDTQTASEEESVAPILIRTEAQHEQPAFAQQGLGAARALSNESESEGKHHKTELAHGSQQAFANGVLQASRAWFSEFFFGRLVVNFLARLGGRHHAGLQKGGSRRIKREGSYMTRKNVVGADVCSRLRALQDRNRDHLTQTYANDFELENHGDEPDFEAGTLSDYKADEDFPLLLAVTRKIVKSVQERFNSTRIQPDFIHLVKRRGHAGNVGMHAHADNCQFPEDEGAGGICRKTEQCCAWRSHTAMLYLSDDDKDAVPHGGEFYFAKGPEAGEERDEPAMNLGLPTCGKFVAFTSGGENLHGLKPLLRGHRYSLAVWFTEDPQRFLEEEPPHHQEEEELGKGRAGRAG
jgi:hypothetical protein